MRALLIILTIAVASIRVYAWDCYIGATGEALLPQTNQEFGNMGGGSIRAGTYVMQHFAVEAEGAYYKDQLAAAVKALWHWSGWDYYDEMFGYSRFDPFFTLGARAWFKDVQLGPALGIGTLFYLTDDWALRGDAEITVGLRDDIGAIFTFGVGIQLNF